MENTEESIAAGLRCFKMITNEVIFGETFSIKTENGTEILIKEPYTALDGSIGPYMANELGNAPAAIQIHPMNVLWSVPLDEFKEANKIYKEATSKIILNESEIVV